MIKVSILRRRICRGNSRTYLRKEELCTRSFETEFQYREWFKVIGHSNTYAYILKSLKVEVI